MPKWKTDSKIEVMQERDTTLQELRLAQIKCEELNAKINKLEKQATCTHEDMRLTCEGGVFGGYDIETCTCCGYEYTY